ncbi:MAG TPA: SIMPL domain-containing protein [Candidatus Acidoferrales bacterium]|nr:SIMPL domain-containing protein [Candidatus Acidoferrales bacterium]
MKPTRALSFALLAIALSVPASSARADSAPAVRTIEVDGSGEARTTPDTADMNVAIETHGATAEEAAARNAALADKVIAALKSKLGDKGKVSTNGYSLNPEYDQRPNREKPTIVGFAAQNSVTVDTGALDLVGPLIDSAIAAGANRVNFVNFTVKDDAKARGEAITIATRKARAQADALAAALGVKLGKIIKATTVSEVRPVPMQGVAMAASFARTATPVEPGEVTVPANVSLVFEIE